MDDREFNLRAPADRRQPRQFEPPPWEREAFEEARRQREQAAQQEQSGSAEPGPVPAEPDRSGHGSATHATAAAEEPGPAQGREQDGSEKPGIEERAMLEMMARLAAEEPKADTAYHKIAYAASMFIAALGCLLLVWGMAALVGSSKTGAVGVMGGSVMLLFGAGFIGTAAWMLVRTMRQQGVL